MKNEVSDVAYYQFTAHDRLFLDTNVWLYVYGPNPPKDKRVADYSDALSRILKSGCSIYVDVLITSEFINTFSRMCWRQIPNSNPNFKDFRKSVSYRTVAIEIANCVNTVLNQCTLIESNFSSLDVAKVTSDFSTRRPDFNDQVFELLCKQEDLTLLTDDGDFAKRGLTILTANKRMLLGRGTPQPNPWPYEPLAKS